MEARLLVSLAVVGGIEAFLYTVQQRASFVLVELQSVQLKSYLEASSTDNTITKVIMIV